MEIYSYSISVPELLFEFRNGRKTELWVNLRYNHGSNLVQCAHVGLLDAHMPPGYRQPFSREKGRVLLRVGISADASAPGIPGPVPDRPEAAQHGVQARHPAVGDQSKGDRPHHGDGEDG